MVQSTKKQKRRRFRGSLNKQHNAARATPRATPLPTPHVQDDTQSDALIAGFAFDPAGVCAGVGQRAPSMPPARRQHGVSMPSARSRHVPACTPTCLLCVERGAPLLSRSPLIRTHLVRPARLMKKGVSALWASRVPFQIDLSYATPTRRVSGE